MPRVRHPIRSALTVLSLLLFIATMGMWVRSGWRDDLWYYKDTGEIWEAESNLGWVAVTRYHGVHSNIHQGFTSASLSWDRSTVIRHDWRQIRTGKFEVVAGSHWFQWVMVNYSIPAAIFSIAPLISAYNWRRRRHRHAPGGFPVGPPP